MAALKTLTKADALALWDDRIAAAAATRRKLAVYVFSRNHRESMLPSQPSDDDKTVVVDSIAALRDLKRGLPLYPAPRAVVKEEALLLSAAGSAAGGAAAAAS